MSIDPVLIQVVPAGPGGICDFAQRLKSTWAGCGRPSLIVELTRPGTTARVSLEQAIQSRLTRVAEGHIGHWALVLHFSGYGYGHRGLCGWLPRELAALRACLGARLRVTVVFHELFATGPPWRSAFWLSGAQARIARALARLADAVWTNTESHAGWLQSAAPSCNPIDSWPVFSNMGELPLAPEATARAPRCVVFGSKATRQRAWDGLDGRTGDLVQLGVDELVELGPGEAAGAPCPGLRHRHLGPCDPQEVSMVLRDSRFALIDYPSRLLGKSGVFAAYAAHACVVVNTRPPGIDVDGLVEGREYLALMRQARGRAQGHGPDWPGSIGLQARRWYQPHGLDAQARHMAARALGPWELRAQT